MHYPKLCEKVVETALLFDIIHSPTTSLQGNEYMYVCLCGLPRKYPATHYEKERHLQDMIYKIWRRYDTRNTKHRTMTPQCPSK